MCRALKLLDLEGTNLIYTEVLEVVDSEGLEFENRFLEGRKLAATIVLILGSYAQRHQSFSEEFPMPKKLFCRIEFVIGITLVNQSTK